MIKCDTEIPQRPEMNMARPVDEQVGPVVVAVASFCVDSSAQSTTVGKGKFNSVTGISACLKRKV